MKDSVDLSNSVSPAETFKVLQTDCVKDRREGIM